VSRIPVRADARAYEVVVGPALLAGCGETLARIAEPGAVLVVTDENVAPLYLEPVAASLRTAGFSPATAVLPPGEESKTLSTVSGLYDRLTDLRADRGTTVVALGGGVVSDLAGFAAATYLRGLRWMALPTSLLAQVDASVGGKTGVNLDAGKNLVGAFHPPSAVLADLEALRTLDPRHIRAGMAEVVKAGLALSAALLSRIEADPAGLVSGDPADLGGVVAAAVSAKADVVEKDEREAGLRRVLNLGHTAGHALEAAAGYGPVLHGEAVAAGITVAARISARRGMLPDAEVERIRGLLSALGLPGDPSELPVTPDPERVAAHLGRDKKRKGGKLALVLLRGAGEAVIVEDGSVEEVMRAL